MKKLRNVLIVLLSCMIIFWTKVSFAATNIVVNKQFGGLKELFIIIGGALILCILFISYKIDKKEEKNADNKEYDEYNIESDTCVEPVESDSKIELENFEENFKDVEENTENSLENSVNIDSDIDADADVDIQDEIYNFKFDDIFDEEIEKKSIKEKFINNFKTDDLTMNKESTQVNQKITNDKITLEEDFLRQLNENLSGTLENDNVEEKSIEEPKKNVDQINDKTESKSKKVKTSSKTQKTKKTTKKSTKTTTKTTKNDTEKKKVGRPRKSATESETKEKSTKKTVKKTTSKKTKNENK